VRTLVSQCSVLSDANCAAEPANCQADCTHPAMQHTFSSTAIQLKRHF